MSYGVFVSEDTARHGTWDFCTQNKYPIKYGCVINYLVLRMHPINRSLWKY